jgi:hypothetical protein
MARDGRSGSLDPEAVKAALWAAEAKVSAQLARVERNRGDLYARQREERALAAALDEVKHCLRLRGVVAQVEH